MQKHSYLYTFQFILSFHLEINKRVFQMITLLFLSLHGNEESSSPK